MLCELGNPFKRNQRVSASPPSLFLGFRRQAGWPAELLHGLSALQAELIIVFEAIGIMLDTREILVWLDLST